MTTTLVLGIDEAGRGPALGPMVMAAVALEPAASRRLSRAGVADSKAFGSGPPAHEARRSLVGLIESAATWVGIEVCDVQAIDEYVALGHLNVLERERASRLIHAAPPCKRVIADGRTLFSPLRDVFPHVTAVDRGEASHVAVAAASLCAKVRRDELFACIADRYRHQFGEVRGLGYANAGTRAFALTFLRRFGALPPEARTSWPWRGRPRALRAGPWGADQTKSRLRKISMARPSTSTE